MPTSFSTRKLLLGIALSLLIVIVGMLLIRHGAKLDEADAADAPFKKAVLVTGMEDPWGEGLPMKVRQLPEPEPPADSVLAAFKTGLKQSLKGTPQERLLDFSEWVVLMELPEDVWEPLLETGRLPTPGLPEVLAGHFTEGDTVSLDGIEFRVVGGLKRPVAGVAFAYVLPYHTNFSHLFETDDTLTGWYDTQGRILEEPDFWPEDIAETKMRGGVSFASDSVWSFVFLGQIVAVLGGALVLILLLRLPQIERLAPFSPGVSAIRSHPVVLGGLLFYHFALFFGVMWLAHRNPVLYGRILAIFMSAAAEGPFGAVIEGIEQGNIPLAAIKIWLWNFGVGTLVTAVLPSIVIPFFAILKQTLTFGVIGYITAPLFMGIGSVYVYHVITVALELQGYIFASFGCVMWPVYLVRGIKQRNFRAIAIQGIKVMASCALLAGVILAVAAAYEAVTIILFAMG